MADSPILDYYRATDSGCNLQRIGETYVEDAYAIGMTKGYVNEYSPASTIFPQHFPGVLFDFKLSRRRKLRLRLATISTVP